MLIFVNEYAYVAPILKYLDLNVWHGTVKPCDTNHAGR